MSDSKEEILKGAFDEFNQLSDAEKQRRASSLKRLMDNEIDQRESKKRSKEFAIYQDLFLKRLPLCLILMLAAYWLVKRI